MAAKISMSRCGYFEVWARRLPSSDEEGSLRGKEKLRSHLSPRGADQRNILLTNTTPTPPRLRRGFAAQGFGERCARIPYRDFKVGEYGFAANQASGV